MYDHRNHCSNNGHILTIQPASETASFTMTARQSLNEVSSQGRLVSLMLRPPWMDSVNTATSFREMWEGLGAVARCELGERSHVFEPPTRSWLHFPTEFWARQKLRKSWPPKCSFCPHAGIIDLSPTSAGRLLIQVVTPWTPTFQGAHRIYGLGAGLCHWFNHGELIQALRLLGVHQVGATSWLGSFLIQHAVVKQVL